MSASKSHELQPHHFALLRALDERGGFTVSQASKEAGFVSASGTCRRWMGDLAVKGLVVKMDDGKPDVWVRTPAGTATLTEAGPPAS